VKGLVHASLRSVFFILYALWEAACSMPVRPVPQANRILRVLGGGRIRDHFTSIRPEPAVLIGATLIKLTLFAVPIRHSGDLWA